MSPHPELVLGFDFGLKHIGVAVGQSLTQTASPLTALKATQGTLAWEAIAALISEWQPQALVVGLPLSMDNKELSITPAAKRFVDFLKAHTELPVYTVDERLTTKEAKQLLFEKSGARGLTKDKIDGVAAKLIVEQWLRQ